MLPACGGDGRSEPEYRLSIDGGDPQTTSLPNHLLTGEGFLPPGSSCSGSCSGSIPPPVFGTLGPYELGWLNTANGSSGTMMLSWICNCGGNAPTWMASISVQTGSNPITVTMRAGGYEQQARVTVTRQ